MAEVSSTAHSTKTKDVDTDEHQQSEACDDEQYNFVVDQETLKQLGTKYLHRIIDSFPSTSERYFDIRIFPGKNRTSYFGDVGDLCMMFHSNKVCVLCLSPTHPVISENKVINKINFQFDGYQYIDRLATKPIGKSKKESQRLNKNSPVCSISCTDSSYHVVTACLNSKLLEANSRLITNLSWIQNYPLSKGYIAIIQPNNWKLMNEVRLKLPRLSYHQ